MKLTGLIPLHASMHEQGMHCAKFAIEHNHLAFECLFFIDGDPYELVLACRGHHVLIVQPVSHRFEIEPFIASRETFFALRRALFVDGCSGQELKISAFFREINSKLPARALPHHRAKPADIAHHRSSVEESGKVYFCGLLDNNLRGNQVDPANLLKTAQWLGPIAHDFCRRRNISTKWTTDPCKEVEFSTEL